MAKFFHEIHGHYDIRFFRNMVCSKQCQKILLDALRHFVEYCDKACVSPILMHGGLIGWHWNQRLLPWDDDIDLCVSEEDLRKLDTKSQEEAHIYDQNAYLLEVNPNYKTRHTLNHTHTDCGEPNKIDARFIDKSTGLFIDITGLVPLKPGYISTKCPHVYKIYDIFPLRTGLLNEIPINIPANHEQVLVQEYGHRAVSSRTFNEYVFNYETRMWQNNFDRQNIAHDYLAPNLIS